MRRLVKHASALSRLLEGVDDAVLVMDSAGKVQLWGGRAADLFGWSAREAIGQDLAEMIVPVRHRQAHRAGMQRYRETGQSRVLGKSLELAALRRDGSEFPIELSIWSVPGSDPVFGAIVRDVSARKALEASLKQSLAEREVILENSLVGILFLDPTNKVRWLNRVAVDMFGYASAADLVGQSTALGYPTPADYERVNRTAGPVMLAGGVYQAEMRMRRSNGDLFWANTVGKAVDPHDLQRGTVWVIEDISPRKELERQLREALEERVAILETAAVGILLYRDGQIVWMNSFFETRLLGHARGTLTGMHPREVHASAEQWSAFVKQAVPVLARGEFFDTELQLKHADGRLLWVIFSGRALEPTDLAKGSIWSVTDISVRKQAEEDTRRALAKERELSELKNRFISMASHEFRTPLAIILSSAELLRDYGERMPPEQRGRLFETVKDGVNRMAGVLEQVLTLGRADAGRSVLNLELLDWRQWCEGVVDQFRRGPGARHRLDFSVEGRPEPRMGDRRVLEHVLLNLLENAIKYSDPGTPVNVTLAFATDAIRLAVTDRGIGIAPQDRDRLFSAFHRGSNVGNIGGTGLGLAIVASSVQLLGGRIDLESEPGTGSTFSVVIPAAAEGAPA